MTDFVTSCASVSDLTTWYSGIPSTVPTADRYIAELTGIQFNISSLTFNTKSTSAVGGIIIRGAVGARPNSPNTNPARPQTSGVAIIAPLIGTNNIFGTTFDGGFVFEDIQFAITNSGKMLIQGGCLLRRVAGLTSNLNGQISLTSTARSVNCIFVTSAATGAVFYGGSGTQDSCTIVSTIDQTSVGLAGSSMNATFTNMVALNLAASPASDPWGNPPTGFFNTAACISNGTSNATAGHAPGTVGLLVNISPSAALVNSASLATLDVRPKAGSVLFNAGVVSTANGGLDWYNDARSLTTPTMGAVEFTTSPAAGTVISPLGGHLVYGGKIPVVNAGGTTVLSPSSGHLVYGGKIPTVARSISVRSAPYKNNTGTLLTALTIPKVEYLKLSDMSSALVLTNQTTDGTTAILQVANAVFVDGTTYLLVSSDATGANVGCAPYVAS